MFWTSTHHPCSKQCKYQGIRHPEPQNVASKLSLKCYKIPADRNSELQSAASTTSLHKHNQRIIWDVSVDCEYSTCPKTTWETACNQAWAVSLPDLGQKSIDCDLLRTEIRWVHVSMTVCGPWHLMSPVSVSSELWSKSSILVIFIIACHVYTLNLLVWHFCQDRRPGDAKPRWQQQASSLHMGMATVCVWPFRTGL